MNRRGFLAAALAAPAASPPRPTLVDVVRVWSAAPHNAFTDLIRFKERWYCAFREGASHVSGDGVIRVLTSGDGRHWISTALLTHPQADLRDPKLSITPDQRLMLTTAGAMRPPSTIRHQSLVWFSFDGREWTPPRNIGEPNFWLWRVAWHRGTAYSIGYSTVGDDFVRLYTSRDGVNFQVHAPRLFDRDYPNESSILFQDEQALCLLRRDKGSATAQLGSSRPPYRAWEWRDLGVRLGGPHMLRLPDGRLLAAGRLYDVRQRTSLLWLDPQEATLTECLTLPSRGDSSYPGLVFHDGLLWVSYYSSHEARTSIYLATVRLPAAVSRR